MCPRKYMTRIPPLKKGEALEVGRAWHYLLESAPVGVAAISFNRNGLFGYTVYLHEEKRGRCVMGNGKTPIEAAQTALAIWSSK